MADDKTHKALATIHKQLSSELDNLYGILTTGESTDIDHIRKSMVLEAHHNASQFTSNETRARIGLPPNPLFDKTQLLRQNKEDALRKIKHQAEKLIRLTCMIEQYDNAADYIGSVSDGY